MVLRNGRAVARPLRVDFGGGTISGEVAFNARSKPPSADADLTLEQLPLKLVVRGTRFAQETSGRLRGCERLTREVLTQKLEEVRADALGLIIWLQERPANRNLRRCLDCDELQASVRSPNTRTRRGLHAPPSLAAKPTTQTDAAMVCSSLSRLLRIVRPPREDPSFNRGTARGAGQDRRRRERRSPRRCPTRDRVGF